MRFFKETQRFDQWWFHLLNLIVLIVMALPIYQVVKSGNLETLERNVLALTVLLVLSILVLVYTIKLKTKIDETGIHYGFFPFHRNFRSVPWSSMDKCFVRKYNPITEYGGWGYRGIRRNSKAFNIKGNQGIQLVLKSGKKILIGTQNPEDAQQTIQNYFRKHERV